MGDIVRVLRVIEYVGDRAAVEAHMDQVSSSRVFFVKGLGLVCMRAATVGGYPELLEGLEEARGAFECGESPRR